MYKYFIRSSAITICIVYLYIFFEWLFFFTKASFFKMETTLSAVSLLFTTPLPPLVVSIFWLVVILFVSNISFNITKLKKPINYCKPCILIVPSLIAAMMFFLLIDNFTYTLVRVGVGRFLGVIRYLYAILFFLIFLVTFKNLKNWSEEFFWEKWGKVIYKIASILIFISISTFMAKYIIISTKFNTGYDFAGMNQKVNKIKYLPNILILSSDGLDSAHMSIYGYPRETTPFIKSLSSALYIFENHFSNSDGTTASVASLLSGKRPTHTRLIFDTDIFLGTHSFHHLPGLLRDLGYWNIDWSIRYWADPYDLNMRDAFQIANGRLEKDVQFGFWLPKHIRLVFLLETYFLEKTTERVISRLKHAFGFADMGNPISEVKHLNERKGPKENRIIEFFDFLGNKKFPFFAHIHLLGTHGPIFSPEKLVFSKKLVQDNVWMDSFYDDAILEFDSQVEEVVNHLREKKLLDSTLLILMSDHGSKWRSGVRIPLIFRFPHQEFRGRIQKNVQTIDIAPTILDYLGVGIPKWMDGKSLLMERNQEDLIIFGAERNTNPKSYRKPFFGLNGAFAIICDRYYNLSVWGNEFASKKIEGHTSPCDESGLNPMGEVREGIIDHLIESGYDVSSLR